MHAPVLVISCWIIRSIMRAARLFAPERRACYEHCDVQEISRSACERCACYLLKFPEGALNCLAASDDSDALPHQSLHALSHGERNVAGIALIARFSFVLRRITLRDETIARVTLRRCASRTRAEY